MSNILWAVAVVVAWILAGWLERRKQMKIRRLLGQIQFHPDAFAMVYPALGKEPGPIFLAPAKKKDA